MKKALIILFIAGCLTSYAQPAQTVGGVNIRDNNTDDMKKYWFYRTKLTNDFMLVGTEPGCSFIFKQQKINYKNIYEKN